MTDSTTYVFAVAPYSGEVAPPNVGRVVLSDAR
jgi:hypothetical protein